MANWSDEDIQEVWEKGEVVSGYDKDIYRKDECGAWIKREKYADRKASFSWEIDHISPGGSDKISNLRPLQWENNVDKSDGKLKCNITSDGNKNISEKDDKD